QAHLHRFPAEMFDLSAPGDVQTGRRHVARVAGSERSSPRKSRQAHHPHRNITRIVSHGEPTPVSNSAFGVTRPVSPPGPVVTRAKNPIPSVARKSRPVSEFS